VLFLKPSLTISLSIRVPIGVILNSLRHSLETAVLRCWPVSQGRTCLAYRDLSLRTFRDLHIFCPQSPVSLNINIDHAIATSRRSGREEKAF
jgi:hypothetical protein